MNLLPLLKEKIADQIDLAKICTLDRDVYFNGALALMDFATETLSDSDMNDLEVFVKDYQTKRGLL